MFTDTTVVLVDPENEMFLREEDVVVVSQLIPTCICGREKGMGTVPC
jgi:hypothetical protein